MSGVSQEPIKSLNGNCCRGEALEWLGFTHASLQLCSAGHRGYECLPIQGLRLRQSLRELVQSSSPEILSSVFCVRERTCMILQQHVYFGPGLPNRSFGCRLHHWFRTLNSMGGYQADATEPKSPQVSIHLHGLGRSCGECDHCHHCMAILER
jgi:hypothetical protein